MDGLQASMRGGSGINLAILGFNGWSFFTDEANFSSSYQTVVIDEVFDAAYDPDVVGETEFFIDLNFSTGPSPEDLRIFEEDAGVTTNRFRITINFTTPPTVTEVVPDSFLVTLGDYVVGGPPELADSDNLDLTLRRRNSDLQSRTEFEVKAISPVATPSSLEATLEGSVFARWQVNQTIELFDYVTAAWEQVDARAATRFSDSMVTVATTGDLSRFVEPGTMCIEARIRYQSPVARQQFSSNTDQFIWTIGQ